MCSHLMWLLSPILPYRMVIQHYNKPAIRAIRKWLSFSWELGPNQTFRTRWGHNGTVHRTRRWYIKHTVNPEAIFTTTLYHIKHLYNSFLHKIMYWLAWKRKKDVNMLENHDKYWYSVSERLDQDGWPLYARHPSVVYVWTDLSSVSHVCVQVS